MKENTSSSSTALVPRQFVTAPIFASKPQKGSREIIVNGEKWIIGSDHPLDVDGKTRNFFAFDIRHGKLIFLLLSKFRALNYNFKTSIHFSVYDLCQMYYKRVDGRVYKEIKGLIYDLANTNIKIFKSEKDRINLKVIGKQNVREKFRKKDQKEPELWLENITFDDEFIKELLKIENLLHIKLDIFLSLKSRMAQTLYAYLPSRAHHHSKNNPFEITLMELLKQIGDDVPQKKSYRERKLIFHKQNYNVIADLDGKPMFNGILRVGMLETADKKDFKVVCWREKENNKRIPAGELFNAWIEGGHTEDEWYERMAVFKNIEFNEYELNALGYVPEWEKHRTFWEMAKALIGEGKFAEIIGDVKNYILEEKSVNGSPIENIGAYATSLITRYMRSGQKRDE